MDQATYGTFSMVLVGPIGLYLLYLADKFSSPRIRLIGFLGALYPLGKAMQGLYWIPSFVRWYVGDIGFIPCIAFLGFLFGAHSSVRERFVRMRQHAIFATAMALAVETFQLFARYNDDQGKLAALRAKKMVYGTGDWNDFAIFVVMGWFTVSMASHLIRSADPIPVSAYRPPAHGGTPKRKRRK
jgi:hypothetical protein